MSQNSIVEISSRLKTPTSLFRYSASFVYFTKEKILEIDRKTRKFLTMHEAHHPKDDVHSLHIIRKEGSRGPISIQECVEHVIARVHHYVQNSQEGSSLQHGDRQGNKM